MSALWDRLKDLPLEVERYELERLALELAVMTRVCTVVHLHGGGHEGVGEDVSYDPEDQDRQLDRGAVLPLAGLWTLESFSDHLGTLELWPAPPAHPEQARYRTWGYESAALDLALRQAGLSLAEALGREARPVTYVCSLRLGEPPTLAPLQARLDLYPETRFKLDPTNDWTPELAMQVAATGAVESLDLKGQYAGTVVDVRPDPDLYRMLLTTFPSVGLEDPHTGVPEIDALLADHQDQVTWDAPIHELADVTGLARKPGALNIKPSRIGRIQDVLEVVEHCEAEGIAMYGGGQTELGPGRGQVQHLASVLYPDGPNDVAPRGFNQPEPPAGMPSSPMPVTAPATGFGWDA